MSIDPRVERHFRAVAKQQVAKRKAKTFLACGCYLLIIAGNLALLALAVIAIVKLVHLAWFGQ